MLEKLKGNFQIEIYSETVSRGIQNLAINELGPIAKNTGFNRLNSRIITVFEDAIFIHRGITLPKN